MPVELSISAIPEMSTLIYFRNDNPDVLVELAEAWIDDNLACRLPPVRAGETAGVRADAIALFRSSLRRRLLTERRSMDPVTGVGQDVVVNEELSVAWMCTVTPNRLN